MMRNLQLIFGSLLIAWLLGELLLWGFGYEYPNFFQPDKHMGMSLKPGAEGWWLKEGKAYIRINSHGQRDDREHTLEKQEGVLRVAVLGDSYAEALQLPMKQAFWSVAEQQLARCGKLADRDVEFINFGVSGYGTGQELLMLRHRVWQFSPDVVVLAFLTGNDIRNNSRVLEGDPLRPYFVLKDGSLVLDESFLQNPNYKFRNSWFAHLVYASINHSRVLQLINEIRRQRRAVEQQEHYLKVKKDNIQEIGLSDSIYQQPTAAKWVKAWEVTDALIKQMAAEVKSNNASFVVMTLSSGREVHYDPRRRAAIMRKFGVDDLSYADSRVLDVAKKAGASPLRTMLALRRWAEANEKCVHGFKNAAPCDGHWNINGHRIAGELLAEHICSSLD